MTAKNTRKKASAGQEPAFRQPLEAHPGLVDDSFSPIIDRKSYDRFIKAISIRIYLEFEKALTGTGIAKPELSLVGLDLKKAVSETDVKMADYIALNARVIVAKAFVDRYDFVSKYMPRIMRELAEEGSNDVDTYLEGKVQRDIMMEIRAIAMLHIPEAERYSYRHKLKVL